MENNANILSSTGLCVVIWLCIYAFTSNFLRFRRSARVLPPGPCQLPIIGNLHQIGKKPHRSFAKLSKTYGPLMFLRLGRKSTVIVSSAEVAREVLQKYDQICCDRLIPMAALPLDHYKYSMFWLPVSREWRNLRKICREHMFSTQSLVSSQGLRQEKLKELRDYVISCSKSRKSVNISEAAFTTTLNLMSKTVFSIDFANYGTQSSHKLKDLVWEIGKIFAAPNLVDFFPVLQQFDPQRIVIALESCFQELFNSFDVILNERIQVRGGDQASSTLTDLLEALLDVNKKNESEFSTTALKHLLLDLFLAGSDATAVTVEWAMAELLKAPEKLEKARAELKQIIGDGDGIVQEHDISRLPYLQATVKETFRLHTAGPLLGRHKANEDVEINGCLVPKDTQIMIDAWAIGRDEATWEQPETFMPERFLESEIDVIGKHFELIPFGSGRRMCPGLPLAYRMVHLMLAFLIHDIEWKLEDGMKPNDLDMEEEFGFTVHKALPLKAIPLTSPEH